MSYIDNNDYDDNDDDDEDDENYNDSDGIIISNINKHF